MTESNIPAANWDQTIRNFDNAHLLQTWEWAQVKAKFGWQPLFATWQRDGSFQVLSENGFQQRSKQLGSKYSTSDTCAASLILQRSIPVRGFAQRMRVLYCPKGPLLDWADNALRQRVLNDLLAIARQHGAIFIKIDPDARLGSGLPGSPNDTPDQVGISLVEFLQSRGWRFSDEQVQFRNTCMIDLTASEEELLSRMKQKTRYNIRLAERKGVTIRHGNQSDIPLLYQMYAETSLRDHFIIRERNYYQTVLDTFMTTPLELSQNQPSVQPLIAEVADTPVAALVVFFFAGKAWYLYGMSREAHREKMPNYLLQWEAVRLAKGLGCQVYDLWGAPDRFDESDSLWGVYRFKEGLGANVVRHIGAWDYPIRPTLYRLYTQTLPRILSIMRRRQKHQNQRMVG